MDVSAVVALLMPYVSAAIGAYGSAVLTKAQDVAADETVGLGRRLLQRVWQRPESRAELESAVSDRVQAPDDDDSLAALRLQIKKALAADPALAMELADMLGPATASPAMTVNAVGERAVAAGTNTGIIQTGDNARAER
ncbi:hypothetical protein SAMN05444920_126106 [Nonomuraea solani]|uniref:Uncharacterized protein n=1 Tax=Nonomuraea solani TaxID=1144553 RepID=A0A1H6EX61_9ACTN|nr:hypothetical protein [Nonomuraea solani]SEH02448.1 hypothetical protein SAMN05444920_126106 [Nonomuraea solani]